MGSERNLLGFGGGIGLSKFFFKFFNEGLSVGTTAFDDLLKVVPGKASTSVAVICSGCKSAIGQ